MSESEPIHIVISSTQLQEFLGCPRRFNFSQLLNLQRVGLDTSKRDIGSLFHEMARVYYTLKKEGKLSPFEDKIIKIMNWGRAIGSSTFNLIVEDIELCVRVFRDYVLYYRDEKYMIDSVESPHSKVLFSGEYNGRIVIIVVEGTTDLEVTNTQNMKIVVDHKTKSKDTVPGILNDQFMCYAWLSDRKYVVVNRILMKMHEADDKRFRREVYEYSSALISEWKQSTIDHILRMLDYQQRGYYPANFNNCEEYGRCQFYDICEQEPDFRPAMIGKDFQIVENEHYARRFEKKEMPDFDTEPKVENKTDAQ